MYNSLLGKELPFIEVIFFLHIKPLYLYRFIDTNTKTMHTKKSYFTIFQSVISVVMLFFSLSLNAQTDSLQGKSYEELTKLYEEALFRNATDAKIYAVAANRIAKEENNQERIGWSLYYIAYADSYIAKFDEAMNGIEKSLLIAKKLENNLLLFKNHNLKGNILSDTEKELKALDEYIIAKKYADLTDDPLNNIVVSVNIAYVKKLHKDHEEAIVLFKENLELLNTIKTSNQKKETYKKQVLYNLADTYLRIQNPKEAAKYNDLALQMSNKKESTLFYYLLLMNDAIINYQQENFDKTIEISKKAERYYLSIDNKDRLVTPYFYMGKSYFKQKKYNETIKYLEAAIQISVDKKIIFSDQKEAHKLLHLSYTEIGKSKKASENFNSYTEVDNKNDSIDKQRRRHSSITRRNRFFR